MQLDLECGSQYNVHHMKGIRWTWVHNLTKIPFEEFSLIDSKRFVHYHQPVKTEKKSQDIKKRLKTNDCWQHKRIWKVFNLAHRKTLSKFIGWLFAHTKPIQSFVFVYLCICAPVRLSLAFELKWWSLFATPHWEYITISSFLCSEIYPPH